jgi:hypothetical protein
MQELHQLSLLDTNIMPIQNNKMQSASSFTFNDSTLFNSTPRVIVGTDKNKQLTIIKPTQTGINRNIRTFCILKSLEPLKYLKTSRVP